MSLFHHNDRNAERLALGWHILGAVISLNIMLISAACAVLLWPVAVHLLAWLCWSLVTDSIIGLGGVGWHIWAISEHMKVLRAVGPPMRAITLTHDLYDALPLELQAVLGSNYNLTVITRKLGVDNK